MTAHDSFPSADTLPRGSQPRNVLAVLTFLVPPVLWLALLAMAFTGCLPVNDALAGEPAAVREGSEPVATRTVVVPSSDRWTVPTSEHPLPWDEPDASDGPSFLAPPPVRPPPAFVPDLSCEGRSSVHLSDSLVVTSWSRNQDSAILEADAAGWYWLYGNVPADSGPEQQNETASLRVSNRSNPDGSSLHTNCGEEWLVQDADNHGSPSGERSYLGLFWLDEGRNAVSLHHTCPRIRAGVCGTFEESDRLTSSCHSYNANSVTVRADAMCAIPVTQPEEPEAQAARD